MPRNIHIVTQDDISNGEVVDIKNDNAFAKIVTPKETVEKRKIQLNLFGEEAKDDPKTVKVQGYKKNNGTMVASYTRKKVVGKSKINQKRKSVQKESKNFQIIDPKIADTLSLKKHLEIEEKLALVRNFNSQKERK